MIFSTLAQNWELDHVIDCDILDRLAIRASCRLFACVNQPDKSETLQRRCPDLRRQFVECLLRQVGGGGNERGGRGVDSHRASFRHHDRCIIFRCPGRSDFQIREKAKNAHFFFSVFFVATVACNNVKTNYDCCTQQSEIIASSSLTSSRSEALRFWRRRISFFSRL